jgi:hypothetical protein
MTPGTGWGHLVFCVKQVKQATVAVRSLWPRLLAEEILWSIGCSALYVLYDPRYWVRRSYGPHPRLTRIISTPAPPSPPGPWPPQPSPPRGRRSSGKHMLRVSGLQAIWSITANVQDSILEDFVLQYLELLCFSKFCLLGTLQYVSLGGFFFFKHVRKLDNPSVNSKVTAYTVYFGVCIS